MSEATAGRPLRIGLTGPIGCGKTTVAGWLAMRGAAVVDADRIAREAVEPGEPALDAIAAEFGPTVVDGDGRLDRASLGRIVFDDPAALRRLEAITSPAVRPRLEAALAAAEVSAASVVVLEAIRLVEAGYAEWCDEVWLISCRSDEQRARLLARGLAPEDVEARIAAQAGLEARVAPFATRVVDASGSAAGTEALVDRELSRALQAHRARARGRHPQDRGPGDPQDRGPGGSGT